MKFKVTQTDIHGNVIDVSTIDVDVTEEELEEEMKLYCSCDEIDDNPQYVENHLGVNHGYICRRCKKFIQIG